MKNIYKLYFYAILLLLFALVLGEELKLSLTLLLFISSYLFV